MTRLRPFGCAQGCGGQAITITSQFDVFETCATGSRARSRGDSRPFPCPLGPGLSGAGLRRDDFEEPLAILRRDRIAIERLGDADGHLERAVLDFPFVIGLARTSDTFANYWFATVFSEIFPDLIDASAGDFNILCYFS